MKILLISGSLRKGSFNTTLAQTARTLLAPVAEATILHFGDLPLFNAEDTYPFGREAEDVREKIAAADGLWFFCPEYNGSYTGVLKNLLDFASLTFQKDDLSSGTPLMGKPCAISGAGGKYAASFAAEELKNLLTRCGATVMAEPHDQFAVPAESFKTGKWEPTLQQIDELQKEAEAFVQFIKEAQS